jgi:hypothetical protein
VPAFTGQFRRDVAHGLLLNRLIRQTGHTRAYSAGEGVAGGRPLYVHAFESCLDDDRGSGQRAANDLKNEETTNLPQLR